MGDEDAAQEMDTALDAVAELSADESGDLGSAESTSEDPGAQSPENTPETADFQGKPGEEEQAGGGDSSGSGSGASSGEEEKPTTVQGWVGRKRRLIAELLGEKEKLKLSFVDKDIPDAYFYSWREDSNKVFSLLVRLKRRLEEEGLEEGARLFPPSSLDQTMGLPLLPSLLGRVPTSR